MIGDITFGQYFPGESFIHRLDPRIKLVLTIVYIAVIFVGSNFISLGVSALLLIVIIAVSKLPVKMMFKTLRPIIPIIIFTSILNMFYAKGNVLLDVGIFQITDNALITAAFLIVRISLLILGSSLLTYTTTPTALTDGLERLLAPLKVFHVRVHELAMMMTIALRFVPTLIDETDKIMSAQKARGADIGSGGLIKRIKALIPILIPLLVSSFRRAVDLATAMECRCYRGGAGRTRLKQLKMQGIDFMALAFMVVILALNITLGIIMPSVL